MYTILYISLLQLSVSLEPYNVTMEEFYSRECDAGNQQACTKLTRLTADLVVQKRLKERSENYWKEIDAHPLLLGRKPDLQSAYPMVMRDYIAMENRAGSNQNLQENRLPECAQHYHNYWINKKLWWPTNENGTPDWPSIYIYIVDHYYGFCLKQF